MPKKKELLAKKKFYKKISAKQFGKPSVPLIRQILENVEYDRRKYY